MNTFGNRLRTLRLEKCLNGIELGKIFNFSKSTISGWESGTREPSLEVLKDLSKYFEVSLDYLMGISDIRKRDKEQNNTKEDIHSFTVKLVSELLKEGIINDPEDIPKEITDMIVAALKHDIRNKKDTK